MYSKPRPLPFSKGGFERKIYTEQEIKMIRKNVRMWAKPYSFSSKYYHVTEKKNLESILKVGLLPNEIDGCIFMTKNISKLDDYTKLYNIKDHVVLEINSLILKMKSFRQSFANDNSIDDVAYLEAIKPEAIKVLEK